MEAYVLVGEGGYELGKQRMDAFVLDAVMFWECGYILLREGFYDIIGAGGI